MNAILDSFGAIDKGAPEPIYSQIKKIVQRRIASGDWCAGQKLPSENDFVAALDVSRMTVNRALRELTQEGLIRRVHGLGSFVAEMPRHASLIELQDIASEIEQDGKRHRCRVVALESVVSEAEIASLFDLAPGTPLYYLRALHYQDDLPMQLESRHVNPEAVPDFLKQDFTRQTATAYLLQQYQPDEMEHRVRAVMPDRETRDWLQMQAGEPCLQLLRRTWNQGRVVTRVTLTYPGGRYELGARYATNEYQLR